MADEVKIEEQKAELEVEEDFSMLNKRYFGIDELPVEQKDEPPAEVKNEPPASPPEPVLPKLEEMKPEQLIAEYKKLQTIANEKDNALKTTQLTIQKEREFISELKANGLESAIEKYGKDFELPGAKDFEQAVLAKQKNAGTLKEWQDTELLKEIESKFSIKPDDFEIDPTELYKDGTPSAYFRQRTEEKEGELRTEAMMAKKRQNDLIAEAESRVVTSREEIKKLFGEDEALFNTTLEEFNALPMKLKNKEVGLEKDPFSPVNIFKGVYHELLVDKAVEKAVANVHAQYKKYGLVLPSTKEEVTDPTNIKGKPEVKREERGGFGMLDRSLNRY